MDLIFDIILAVLLCTAIGYGFTLNRRLVGLRKDQESLDKLAKSFAAATSSAEASIIQLKLTSDATSQALDQTLKQAGGIREDLVYLIERGNKLADILESDIRSKESRPSLAGNSGNKKPIPAYNKDFESPAKGEAERELIKALKAVR